MFFFLTFYQNDDDFSSLIISIFDDENINFTLFDNSVFKNNFCFKNTHEGFPRNWSEITIGVCVCVVTESRINNFWEKNEWSAKYYQVPSTEWKKKTLNDIKRKTRLKWPQVIRNNYKKQLSQRIQFCLHFL